MFRKIDKTSTFNDVLKQIIEKIQTGELKPGDVFRRNVFWLKNSGFPDLLYVKF